MPTATDIYNIGVGGGYGASGLAALANFFKRPPSIPTINPRKPGAGEQASKAGLVFGPGDRYNLGLYDAAKGGSRGTGFSSQGSQPNPFGFNFPQNFRFQSNPETTPAGFGGMVVDPSLRTRIFGGNLPSATRDEKGLELAPEDEQDFLGNIFLGNVPGSGTKKPKRNRQGESVPRNIFQAGILAGLTPFEQQQALQGVGREGFEAGLLGGFENVGTGRDLVSKISSLADETRGNNAAEVEALRKFVLQNADAQGKLFDTDLAGVGDAFKNALSRYGNLDTSSFIRGSDELVANASNVANRAANEAFVNKDLGRTIASEALSDKDFLRNLVESRFGQTDTFLNDLFSGLSPQDNLRLQMILHKPELHKAS